MLEKVIRTVPMPISRKKYGNYTTFWNLIIWKKHFDLNLLNTVVFDISIIFETLHTSRFVVFQGVSCFGWLVASSTRFNLISLLQTSPKKIWHPFNGSVKLDFTWISYITLFVPVKKQHSRYSATHSKRLQFSPSNQHHKVKIFLFGWEALIV